MKTIYLLLVFLILAGCKPDQSITIPEKSMISNRGCPGDWTHVQMEKGKCRNDCQRGLSIRCGGYVAKQRCGQLFINIPSCGESFNGDPEWEEMTALSSQDSPETVDYRIEFPDQYHAKFVILDDVSDELAIDNEFTVSNNVKWYDELGFTFGLNKYHNFQFIGGDYPIVITQDYPFGVAIVDIYSY